MNDAAPNMPIAEVSRRVSSHLDALAAEVHAIEHAIGDELSDAAPSDVSYVKRLQRLDYVRQSLEDLAMLNLVISEHCRGALPEGAVQKLRLESTRELLGSRTLPAPNVISRSIDGDVDLF